MPAATSLLILFPVTGRHLLFTNLNVSTVFHNLLTTTDCFVLPLVEPTTEAETAAMPVNNGFDGTMQSKGSTGERPLQSAR
jgi:hypothetical protein